MDELINKIKNKSWEDILLYSKSLSDSERFSTIKRLQGIDINRDILKEDGTNLTGKKRTDFYENRQQTDNCLKYFLITCTRSYQDVKALEVKHEYGSYNPFYSFFTSNNAEPLVNFYKLFPPNYLNRTIKEFSENEFSNFNFKILWELYKNKWIPFDEDFFIRSLLVIHMFKRSTIEDANFLLENRDALENVFLKFHEYEIPILDISKWYAREGFVCKKVYEFWTEVIIILQEKGYQFDRVIVKKLLESLLNNWKKGHLDWHVRLLKLFKPIDSELLENQSTLFSILGTGHPSLMNYAMQCIKRIYKHEGFDKTLFIESFPITFSNDKIGKSILIGLDILENFLSNISSVVIEYREQLSILLMQTDTKIQEKTAQILVTYFKDSNLSENITPYFSYLKQNTKNILSLVSKIEPSIFETNETQEYLPISLITSWDELLIHIGTCIRTKSAQDIDIFYESLNQLQFEIPTDFEKQLKPYTKQLQNRFWESRVMIIFSSFIECWSQKIDSTIKVQEHNPNPIPFFAKKSELLLKKLKNKNNLPFLSTPTHKPFFINPIILLDKLIEYEALKKEVDLEDLIVACNRISISENNKKTLEKSKKLNGYYAEAIQYFFGAINKINYTEDTLPLWVQITRIKNPNDIFSEFENSLASSYPGVVKPFWIDYEIDIDANEYATWYRLLLANNFNYTRYRNEKVIQYPSIFYNTVSAGKGMREDIAFQLSLNPSYLDTQLCRYIPDTASGNEVSEFEACLYPMQFVLENQLRIYHSGWIYIATCLIFEKKVSRDLASEYIQLAMSRKENLDYLAETISKLISLKYAPVNRLIEYFDKPNSYIEIKQFQLQILEHCILFFDKENLPRSSKKIITYYKEWLASLNLEMPKRIEEQLNKLKK